MQNPDQQYLKECFSYDSATGEMRWLERPPHHFRTAKGHKVFNAQQSGKKAGCGNESPPGHVYLKVRVNKRLHLCHRLAWVWMNGDIPAGMEVDHIDGNTLNNSAANLRLVTSSGNSKNSRRRKNVKAPYQGVYWYDRLNACMVQINTGGKTINLGVHRDLQQAIAVRQSAERLYGFHANHGRTEALS
jgi:hypothetical protein